MSDLNALTATLDLALQKPSRPRSATHIHSQAGNEYRAGSISSDSSLFDIVSEHVALVQALQHNDFQITKVVTLTEESTISPIAIKVLKDYAARVGCTFTYEVFGSNGEILLAEQAISKILPEYVSPAPLLKHIQEQSFIEHNYKIDGKPSISDLKKYASLGMQHHFLSAEHGSRYGCALVSSDGTVYIGGAYGSPDKRLGLHAEMATIASAITAGAQDIIHIAIISTKYPDTPCPCCGHCRQVLSEILDKIGGNPEIVSLASESDVHEVHTLETLLPHQWRSKKW